MSHAVSKTIQLTDQERQWLAAHPTVTFTGDPNWLPYEAFDHNGQYIGIVSEHLKLISKTTGLKFTMSPSKTWTESTEKAKKGQVDILSETDDSDLKSHLDFTQHYLANPIVIAMHSRENYVENITDIKDRKIALIKDYGYASKIRRKYSDIQFITVDDIQHGLVSVSTGEVDALLCTLALCSYTISELGLNNVRITGKTEFDTKLALGVQKNLPELLSVLNKAIQQITPGQQQVILDGWIKQKYVEKVDYILVYQVIIIALFLIAVFFFWNRRLKHEIDLRTDLEKELIESESLHRSVVTAMVEGIVVQDRNLQVTTFNKSALKILGLSKDQLLGLTSMDPLWRSIHEDGSPFPGETHPGTLSLRTGESYHNIIMGVHRPDDSLVWISINSEPLVHDGETQAYGSVASFTDITERKRVEDELRLSQQRLLLHREQNPLGVIEWNPGFEILDWNESAERIFGFTKEEVVGQHIYKKILPESAREAVDVIWDDLINNRGGRRSTNENITKDGRIILCEWYNTSLVNEDGEVIGVASIVDDVTDRYRAEEELRLYSLVLENSSEGMMITDSENKIIAINPAFTQITGYNFDEVKDQSPSMLSSGRHDQSFYESLWAELAETGRWQGEIWDKRKNDEIYAKWLTINSIQNEDASIQRYIALFSDITEKKLSEEMIWKQANFDSLTNLPNRNMFLDRLEQELRKSDRANGSLALLLIDLDQFKEVNDTLGHDVGDLLLQEAGRRIRDCVRTTDTVARLGGDEFTIILPELHGRGKVEDVAQKVMSRLADVYQLGDHVIHVSGSIGITLYPDDAKDIDTLMKNADQAMYAAKKEGRDRFSYFTQSLQDTAQNRLNLKNDLRHAIVGDEFKVYFQPIVDLANNKIIKAEALLRWMHPRRGLVGPLEFIPLSEETGLINEIGDWVFRESARWTKLWNDMLSEDFQVSVNMSPVQFRTEDEAIATQWLAYLNELGLSGENIVVEITEGLLLNAESKVIDKLYRFRDAGIKVAIDDFGTGYSSLSYLKKFDIDYLKIDQTFVRNLETDTNDIALSEAIIVMAHKLGLKVIAEGVETESQRNILANAGCDYAQGYLYSRPVPPKEFEIILKQ